MTSNSWPAASGASAVHLKSVGVLLLWFSPGVWIVADVGPPSWLMGDGGVCVAGVSGVTAPADDAGRVGVTVGVLDG